ncbi:oxaloacetate decarboxylase [Chloroflexota bacterium]
MNDMGKKMTRVLRELLESKEIVVSPGVAIPLNALMAEAAGFKVVRLSGSNTANQIYGIPDAGLITMTEMVENIRHVCNAVSIPVIADCDTGFGNAINVRRTVREVIKAGCAGVMIEDQVSPKRCGFTVGKELISVEEAVGKYRAAVDARNELDPDFCIQARTDARTAVGGSLEEVIRRAKAYKEEAGVDMLYVEALQSREEIKKVRAAVAGPLTVSTAAFKPEPSLEELQELGLCMTSRVQIFWVGNVAIWDLLTDMKKRGLAPWREWEEKHKDHPMGIWGVFDLVGFPKVREWEEKYLSKENLEKYDKSQGLYDARKGWQPFIETQEK